MLNFGAPRNWALEFEPDLPPLVRDYLRFLVEDSPGVAMKFTRMYREIPLLRELIPDGRFVHVVRDPRAVAGSYLLGEERRTVPPTSQEGL